MWARLKDMGDMGYGFRYGLRLSNYVTNNIIGLSTFAGLDRTRVDMPKNKQNMLIQPSITSSFE